MTVCIIGNSLTSLTLAKALVKQNIYVDLFIKKNALNLNHTRTLGISKSNLEFFNKNVTNIEKIIWKLKRIEIFTDNLNREKLIKFENENDHIFSIIRNQDLFKILENDLSKTKYFKRKISNCKNFSFLKDYDLVVNCENFNFVTNKYFSKKIIKKYNSYAYTSIIKHQKLTNDIAVQIFTRKGPLAFLPISNEETSIVYSVPNLIDEKKFDIKKLIYDYNFKYKIKKFEKFGNFELKSINLKSYHHKNILAFGDLLHKIHPLAGQGFNMTIRDLKVFMKIIISRNNLGLPLDISVNIEFEKSLRHKNLFFSSGIDFIYEFFNLERKFESDVLSKSIQFFGKNYTVNKLLKKIADKGILF